MPLSSSSSGPRCGDAKLNGTEQCDDGANLDGDGCDATCHFETWFEITQIRRAIHDGTAATVALNSLPIHAGVVTYVKQSAGGAAVGTVDGPGFFVQNRGEGPALFFAMNPASIATTMAKGDVLDLTVTEGKWMSCPGTCTADNSMYVITAASGQRVGSGAVGVDAQELSNDGRFRTTIPTPVSNAGWDLEQELVTITGTINTDFGYGGTGFKKAVLDTAGTLPNTSMLVLRVVDSVVVSKDILQGCQVTVSATPMWRYGGEAQLSAWQDADLTVVSCPPPVVVSTTPADGDSNVSESTSIVVKFNRAMDPTSLTAQTVAGACSETVQVSADGFATCLGFAAGTPIMSAGDTTALFQPSPTLSYGSTYKIRVTATASTPGGTTLPGPFVSAQGFSTAVPGPSCDGSVVISQVYGGGGNSGATWRNDFVELHNRGGTPVSLAGWSVQYASDTGPNWTVNNLSGSIAAGGYFLVQLAAGGSGAGNPLPAPDLVIATSPINAAAATAKIALVSTATALSGECPQGGNIVDFIGYGQTVTCYEVSRTSNASATNGLTRLGDGCVDTNNNGADFALLAPNPRNGATAPILCACAGERAANETGTAAEADACSLVSPQNGMSAVVGLPTPVARGQILEAGITAAPGADPAIRAQAGWGPMNANPTTQQGWTFTDIAWEAQSVGDEDIYAGSFTAPSTAGTYYFTVRFSVNNGAWTYCDKNGAGSNASLVFEVTQLPIMTVTEPVCGDSQVTPNEECDDGNLDDTDDCTSECKNNICGDDIQNLTGVHLEECDDGLANNDTAACTSSCKIATCGDSLVWTDHEECDQGGSNSDTGACTAGCKNAECGDSLVWTDHEECDQGGANSDTGACTSGCKNAECGDSLVWSNHEECDLGTSNSDTGACTTGCLDAECGDHLIWSGVEQCDDGNHTPGDGCNECQTEGASTQIAAIRRAIHDASASPIALPNMMVIAATVTQVKGAIGGYGVGHPDGPSFVIQSDSTGPAILVAIDPATIATNPDMAAGDVVDLVVTEGQWLSCSNPITAQNCMYVITAATGSRLRTGAPLPQGQDLTGDSRFGSPIANPVSDLGWDIEHERIAISGTISGNWENAGNGFQKVTFTPNGMETASSLKLRLVSGLILSKALVRDCMVTVNNTPMWRYAAEAQTSAWVDADLTVDSCPALVVNSTTPANGDTSVSEAAKITVTFNRPMDPTSLTSQTVAGGCSGAIQVSADNFNSCIAFATATPAMASSNMVATASPASALEFDTTYKVRVTVDAKAGDGVTPLSAPFEMANGFTTRTGGTTGCSPQVVISQVYGGGGGSTGVYKYDFIELHNRGNTSVDMTGWSIQYGSAGGTSGWTVFAFPSSPAPIIPSGGYFLIQAGNAGSAGVDLPAPVDAIAGGINMGGTGGKVALLSNATQLSGACPASGAMIDQVGYGAANCSESNPTSATTSATGVLRAGDGCTDTNNNAADFTVAPPAPRNSASSILVCSCAG